MSRAGREPAEDVKRRLVEACRQAGLTDMHARMHLSKEAGRRIIDVGAALPGWPHDVPTVSILASVKVTGDSPRFVDVRCTASHENPIRLDGPWMKGRTGIPMERLVEELRETLEERELVISAAMAGIPGPYKFKRSVWAKVDLLGALPQSPQEGRD